MTSSTRKVLILAAVVLLMLTTGLNPVNAQERPPHAGNPPPTAEWPRWSSTRLVELPDGEGQLHLSGGRALEVQFLVDGAIQDLPAGTEPTTMVAGDVDGDGIEDVVVGCSSEEGGLAIVYRGNRRALYPVPTPPAGQHQARTPHNLPFNSPARVIRLAGAPQHMALADFDSDGSADLVVAADSAATLVLHRGNGLGWFEEPEEILTSCRVTALTAGTFGLSRRSPALAVALASGDEHHLQLFSYSDGALTPNQYSWSLPNAAHSLELVAVDPARGNDLAVVAGNELLVAQGGSQALNEPATIDLPVGVDSLALGDFAHEEPSRPELAVLSNDGSASIYRVSSSWQLREIASQEAIPAPKEGQRRPSLMPARVSSGFTSSMVVVDSANSALQLLRSRDTVAALKAASVKSSAPLLPAAVSNSQDGRKVAEAAIQVKATTTQQSIDLLQHGLPLGLKPLAAVSMRLGPDALRDLVLLGSGNPHPIVIQTLEAETVTVTTISDIKDGDTSSITALINDPGSDTFISLREAIEAANNTEGSDAIEFNILQGCDAVTSVCTITPIGSGLPRISEAMTISGTSQPGYLTTPLIHLDGTAVDAGVPGLAITGGMTTVSALVFNGFSTNSDIVAWYSGGNKIESCFFGTDAAGQTVVGSANGIHISGISNNTIGGAGAARNVFAGSSSAAIALTAGANGNTVTGNIIGADADGMNTLGYSGNGILIYDASGNTVGGEINLITGGSIDNHPAVALAGPDSNGNQIIGNTIAANAGAGVYLAGTAGTSNLIAGNALDNNGGLGIDLCASADP
ncbi:MAG: hypothetical protein GY906_09115, partial [bacterium]|nr:hypothetical protein [bacterium]